MKLSVVLFGLVAAFAAVGQVDAAAEVAESSSVHIRIHVDKHHDKAAGAICYKQCPSGQYCARGTTTCRAPKKNTSECFNPATSVFISKCDAGFVCRNGKCDYANHKKEEVKHENKALGAICYKQCPSGQYCARGTTTCRAPAKNTSECFNPATALFIPKCDAGFVCRNGKCDYANHKKEAKKEVKKEEKHHDKAAGAICYKQCPSGQYCARGTTTCRAPKKNTSECFNPATSVFISKCDAGFTCRNGKCDYANLKEVERYDAGLGAICYKQCPSGQYCARGTTTCRAPAKNTSECFNPATGVFISKCDPGFVCRNGKCDYK